MVGKIWRSDATSKSRSQYPWLAYTRSNWPWQETTDHLLSKWNVALSDGHCKESHWRSAKPLTKGENQGDSLVKQILAIDKIADGLFFSIFQRHFIEFITNFCAFEIDFRPDKSGYHELPWWTALWHYRQKCRYFAFRG